VPVMMLVFVFVVVAVVVSVVVALDDHIAVSGHETVLVLRMSYPDLELPEPACPDDARNLIRVGPEVAE